jgi:HAD superfamily phosphatase
MNEKFENTRQNNGRKLQSSTFKSKAPKLEAVLFDMDGVIRDVSQSYRMAIKKTVGRLSGTDATNEEISKYKSLGINNDWELCYQILLHERSTFATYQEKATILPIITSIFQKFYLGESIDDKFTGFIENERFVADILQKLKSKYKLGIISTAPRNEIDYALGKARAIELFHPVIYAMEDLDEAKEIPKASAIEDAMIYLKAKTACYLGDGLSDMKAAVAVGIVPIGIVPAGINDPAWESKLIAAGALNVFKDVNEAINALLLDNE